MTGKFTYPFCYVPHPLVVEAAHALIDAIDGAAEPSEGMPSKAVIERIRPALFEGKMLGVMMVSAPDGVVRFLYAFSGLLCGSASVQGFVPPIFDYSVPDGYFRQEEARIASLVRSGNMNAASASAALQDWLFRQYRVVNAFGEEMDVKEIFAQRGLVPPGGTGDCAGPRLLNHALRNGLNPVAMGEFWYGRSPRSEVREQGRFYPSCTGKCGPLLGWMMRGLDVDPNPLDEGFASGMEPEVLYEDQSVIVVDKPAGMLSVPGRVPAPDLLGWLREKYGEQVESCHRLDMDTSGIMVFARNIVAKSEIERQFASREVVKAYRARLVAGGGPFRKPMHGTIALPLSLDYYDRPRQMVDFENGKLAVTEYEVLSILSDGEIDIRFRPKTGRTHQLRVHSAHSKGLGRPIKGDRLYGDATGDKLFLRADYLEFTHPETGKRMKFGKE